MKPKTWIGVTAAVALAGATLKHEDISSYTSDIAHRVENALQNPDDRIKNAIDSFSDKDFIQRHTQKNLEYYQSKITDSKSRDAIVNTATRYDIAVHLYEKGILSEKDMIEHISLGRAPIVCLPNVSMTQTWTPIGGEVREITQQELFYPQDAMSSFASQIAVDGGYVCDFSPRPQGGGYIATIKEEKTAKVIGKMEQAFKVY